MAGIDNDKAFVHMYHSDPLFKWVCGTYWELMLMRPPRMKKKLFHMFSKISV